MSLVVPTYLLNYQAVPAAFGYWPGFHDATVLEFVRAADSIRLTLHGFEMTPEVDKRGFFKLIKHHLVGFVFHGVHESTLASFKAGSILMELEFSRVADFESSGRFRVTMESLLDCTQAGAFSAVSGGISEVVSCGPRGERLF